MSISDWLAIGAVMLAIGALVARQHQHSKEIERLRLWRHKIGEDPSHTWTQVAEMLDERIRELERRRR